jgi:hypothetical protein
VPSLLTLDRGHGAIRDFLICLPVQRDSHRKAGRAVVPNDLNAADAFATRPLSNRLQTIFSEIRVAHSDRFEFYHLKFLSRRILPALSTGCVDKATIGTLHRPYGLGPIDIQDSQTV